MKAGVASSPEGSEVRKSSDLLIPNILRKAGGWCGACIFCSSPNASCSRASQGGVGLGWVLAWIVCGSVTTASSSLWLEDRFAEGEMTILRYHAIPVPGVPHPLDGDEAVLPPLWDVDAALLASPGQAPNLAARRSRKEWHESVPLDYPLMNVDLITLPIVTTALYVSP